MHDFIAKTASLRHIDTFWPSDTHPCRILIKELTYKELLTADVGIQVADREAIFSLWPPGYSLSHEIKCSILFPLPDSLHHQQHLFRQGRHCCF